MEPLKLVFYLLYSVRSMFVSLQISGKWRNLSSDENQVLWSKAVTCKEEILLIFPSCCTLWMLRRRLCIWDVCQKSPWDQFLWWGKVCSIHQGRNGTVIWASSLCQLLELVLELKRFISFSVLYWNDCEFIPPPQSALSVDHSQKGCNLNKGAACSWGHPGKTQGWKGDLGGALTGPPLMHQSLVYSHRSPPVLSYFSFFLLYFSLFHSPKPQCVFAMCQAQSQGLGI